MFRGKKGLHLTKIGKVGMNGQLYKDVIGFINSKATE